MDCRIISRYSLSGFGGICQSRNANCAGVDLPLVAYDGLWGARVSAWLMESKTRPRRRWFFGQHPRDLKSKMGFC